MAGSVDGKGPRSISTRSVTIADHNSTEFISVFSVFGDDPPLPPLFSFQICVTFPIGIDSNQREKLSISLYERITLKRSKPSFPFWRLDVHFIPNATKDACLSYYREDKQARGHKPLRVMSGYKDQSTPTGGVLVLLDHEEWEEKGVGVVYFDLNKDFLEADRAPGEPEPKLELYWDAVPICSPKEGWSPPNPYPVNERFWDFYCYGPGEYLQEKLEETLNEGKTEW